MRQNVLAHWDKGWTMGADLLRIYYVLDRISSKLTKLEQKMDKLDEKMELSLSIQRNHLIRVKNNQPVNDEMILLGRPYNDLSPQDALRIYSNPDMDFIFLDVSEPGYEPQTQLQNIIKISLEELPQKYQTYLNHKSPVLIISEDGLRSILACEYLVKKGFFNVNNISGGHEYWPKKNNVVELRPKAESKVAKDTPKTNESKPAMNDFHPDLDFDENLWKEGT